MDRRAIVFVISLTLALLGVRYVFDTYYPPSNTQVLQKEQVTKESAKKDDKAASFVPNAQNIPQKHYVLENEYLQLVFSNIGGAITEINLPFQSKNDPKSAVLPIEFDRQIQQISPENAHFPLYPTLTYSGETREGVLGGYYPLLRRDLLGAHGFKMPASDYALNVVSEYPELAELVYEVKQFSKNEIVFQAQQPHRRITKKFTLPEDGSDQPYVFLADIKVEGDSRGLWLTSGIPEIEWQSGSLASVIKYRISRGNSHEVLKLDVPKSPFTLSTQYPDWVCNSNGFFGLILDPTKGNEAGFRAERVEGARVPSRLTLIDSEHNRFPASEMPGVEVLLPIKASGGDMQVRLFAGPFADDVLETVDNHYKVAGDKTSDYMSCQTYHGWFAFISEPFANFLFFLMKLCHNVTGSWALSIVFVTIVLRIILYPLNTWSIRSMKGMQEVAPQIKAIQERYKKEPHKAQMEIMAIYRSKGVNPISGCLPLLLQLPFLIGMFDLLKSSFELRGAPFIPGWIDDLASPDVLFSWHTPLPLIGNEFHLLPILLGVIMYVQQNLMSTMPKDPSLWTDQQRQQRTMGNIMTVVMTVLFYNFPSGLNIYWISSMLLGILQQWWVTKQPTQQKTVPVEIEVRPKKKK